MELLIAALQDEDMGVREAAARAFGQIGDSRAVEPLIAMLKDRNRKHEAVRYKGKFIGSICIKGSTAGPRSVCWAAAEALGKIGDSRAVEPLIAALKEKDPIRNLIEVLGQIGDARAVELFIAFLSTRGEVGQANMRRQAAEALVRIYHQETLDEESKQRILAAHPAITRLHHDTSDCYSYTDDGGIGVDFPL